MSDPARTPTVAYLVNLYPAVSHTFIRREILALERQGVTVVRIALRPDRVVDPADRAEQALTRYVMALGPVRLLLGLVVETISRPRKMLQALHLMASMAGKSNRPAHVHVGYLAEACTVRRWSAQAQVDHLHAHFATNTAEIAMLCRVLGGPAYSFTAHGSDIMDRPAQVGLNHTIRHAAFALAVCHYGRSQILRWIPRDLWPRVEVVRCGLDASYANGPVLPVPGGSVLRFVCVGRLSAEKGQLVLLEAARMLRDEGRVFTVVLVGDGPMRKDLEAVIAREGLGAVIEMFGAQAASGVKDALASARALVVPSLSEGLPVVIMEAMAMRRPVIAPFLAGIPELVYPGNTGWLYPAGSSQHLADSMRACLDADLQTLRAMGDRGLSAVRELHDIDREAGKLLALIRRSADAAARAS